MAAYYLIAFHDWTLSLDQRCTAWNSPDQGQLLIANLVEHEINMVVSLIDSGLRFSAITGVTIEQTTPKHYRFILNCDNALP